mmetsp:Transcript_13098/g.19339  ORF Transcript_13098/g.19339 Transcript_13098/m.19339 type:complete len:98 (+) Transcript_13098:2017-2310(+)
MRSPWVLILALRSSTPADTSGVLDIHRATRLGRLASLPEDHTLPAWGLVAYNRPAVFDVCGNPRNPRDLEADPRKRRSASVARLVLSLDDEDINQGG